MQIVSLGDNLHEMSKLFSGKNKKNFINLSSAVLAFERGKGQKTPTDLSKDINPLTLCRILADDILYFFLLLFIRESKTLIGLSCESSAQQKIHIACQVLFSLKKKTNKQKTKAKKKMSAAVVLRGRQWHNSMGKGQYVTCVE